MQAPSPQFASLMQHAVAYACRKHRHQTRKDGFTPYASHVVRVAFTANVLFGSQSEVVLLAALLHDLIEDTTTDYEDIEDRFGPAVAIAVAALTKNMALPEAEREREYDLALSRGPWEALVVKLADVYDNFCDLETYPIAERAEQTRKARERCERAITLAQPHAAHHPELQAGIVMVRGLLQA
jgi:guanosine-3',5'-bis(diphosphate) 3'-pyrophosphohydrolase